MDRRILLSTAALAVAACGGPDPTAPQLGEAALAVVDGSTSGNAHFYFLPPMVDDPLTTGTFDADADPLVRVCAWSGAECDGPNVAEFTTHTGPGSETIRVDHDDEHYIVNWHLRDFDLVPGEIYRVSVLVRGQELGYAEVLVAENGREARNARTLGYIGLVDNRTLPVKFRIEEGAFLRWASISSYHLKSCGVTVVGTGLCWGGTGPGTILGDGTTNPSATPVTVTGGHEFAEIATGHIPCGVTTGGDGYCWGGNLRGRIGSGSFSPGNFPSPTLVTGGHDFRSIRGDHDTNCGVTTAGVGYCWGGNWAGQLGAGYVGSQAEWNPTPRAVVGGLTWASAIEQGFQHGCGVAVGGVAYCWGGNDRGQLGDGTFTKRGSPTPVPAPVPFVEIDTGHAHTCALSAAGPIYCWGGNDEGQLGNGSLTSSLAPVEVAGAFVSVTVGRWHSCALDSEGRAYCWGRNAHGQLGDGTTEGRQAPVPAASAFRFTQLSGGREHTCGITVTQDAVCWGKGVEGQLGNALYTDSSVPVYVLDPLS